MKKLSIYLVLVLIVFSGCKKYEEGPLISLRSKEKRLCQEWELKKIEYNGSAEALDDINNYYWDIDKNGTINVNVSYVDWGDETMEFKWEWIDNKEGIKITTDSKKKGSVDIFHRLFKNNSSTNDDEVIESIIMKLTYDEFIFEFDDFEDEARFEFEKK